MFLKPILNDQAAASRGATAAIATDLAAAKTAGVKPLYGRSVPRDVTDNPSVTFYESDTVNGSRIRLAHVTGTRVASQWNQSTMRNENTVSLAKRQGFLLSEVAEGQNIGEETSLVDYGAQAKTVGDVGYTLTTFRVDDGWRNFVNGVQNLDPKKGILAGQFVLRDGAQDGMELSLRFIDGAAVLFVTTLEGSNKISLHRMVHQENPRFGLLRVFSEDPYVAAAYAPVPSSEPITFGRDQTLTDLLGGSFYSGTIFDPSDMFKHATVYVLPAKPKEPSAAG